MTRLSLAACAFEVANYYRDLFVHKMGPTPNRATHHFLLLLDGLVFGVTAINAEDVWKGRSGDIFELYGMSMPLTRYHSSNRLLMTALTSTWFRNIVQDTTCTNRIFRIEGFRTTCISKGRKQRTNVGLMEIINRERMPDGRYKLLYRTEFHPLTPEEIIKSYLAWQQQRKGNSGDTEGRDE